MSDPGYIYVLINPSMHGLVKIGKTTREPSDRAKELSAVTGIPTAFVLVFDQYFDDCSRAEGYVHTLLEQKNYRVSSNKEFFDAPVNEVIKTILQTHNALEGRGRLHLDEQTSLNETSGRKELNPNWTDGWENWREVYDLAMKYYLGKGDTLQDYPRAMKLLKQAVKLGSSLGCVLLGSMYKCGLGCQKDDEKAFEYFEEATRRGISEGYVDMAAIFVTRRHFENALKCWDKYFSSDDSSNSEKDKCRHGYEYFKQVEAGLPVRHQTYLAPMKDGILDYANKALARIQSQKTFVGTSSFPIRDAKERIQLIMDTLFRNSD